MKNIKNSIKTIFLATGIIMLAALKVSAQTDAEITTDQPVYVAGTTVTFNGSGFLSGEPVLIEVEHLELDGDTTVASTEPVEVFANDNGEFVAEWQIPAEESQNEGDLVATARGMESDRAAQIQFSGNIKVDFRQSANNDAGFGPDAIHWINSILQQSNSSYTEGMSSLQRLVLANIEETPDNIHTLQFGHQFSKGGHKAYDFLTGNSLGSSVGWNVAYEGPISVIQEYQCAIELGPPADLAALCAQLHTAPNYPYDVELPNDPYIGVQQRINAYESLYGERYMRIYGDQPIVNAYFDTIMHSDNDLGDSYVNYNLVVVTASTALIFEMGGHLAISGLDNLGINWGPDQGAGSINGGPYHFKLYGLGGSPIAGSYDLNDFVSLGAQDNQIKAGDIIPLTCECEITGNAGPVCPGASNSYCAPSSTVTSVWSISGNGSISGSGNCIDVIAGNSCGESYTLTLSSTNDQGCITECSITVVVEDTTAPVIASLPAPSTIDCPATPVFAQASATDACDSNVTLTFNDVTTPGNCPGNYSVTRTWTATDDCGNASSASQTINVQDITAPVIASLPAPSTIDCPATPVFAQASATDACDSNVTLTFNDVTTPGNCPGNYSVTRTWTATDDCGNASSASQTINVQDITAPVIASLPAPSTIDCPATPVFAQASATDACDNNVTLTFNDVTTPGNCPGNYSVTRTWTATDDCGNASSASQTINVQDITAPVIASLPAPSTIDCPATPVFAQASATDACDNNVTLTFNDVTTPGNCPGNYSVTRTWTATDDCGNASSASQTINVQDITAPVIASLPAPSTIDCPATPVFAQASATDACDSNVTLTFNDVTTPGNCPGNYSVTRTWTATDDCGNASSASQTINVQDITAPVIASLPAPSTIDCPATPVFAQASATDACDSNVTLTFNDVTTPGNCPGNYSVTRTWTATDDCGNTSSASQTINVQDITAPVIASLPAPSTIDCPATPVFAQASATDACDSNVTLTFNDVTTPGNCPGNYSVTRTWTATDDCGNASSASQTINVQDITAPVIASLPAPSTIDCPATPVFAQASATDACDSNVTLTFNDVTTPGNCPGNYSVTRTWTATDDCGNASSASQTINVQDITAPTFITPADVTLACADEVPSTVLPTATDECSSVVVISSDNIISGDCANRFVVEREFSASDECGNTYSDIQTIIVNDNIAPVIAPLSNALFNCVSNVTFEQAVATDNCSGNIELTYEDEVTCQYTTYSKGGWGSTSSSTPGQYRDANFASVFPSGLTIGCSIGSFTFTDAQAIEDFIPSGGGAEVLPAGNTVNPSAVVFSNNFADQLMAAMLNANYDAYDEAFGLSDANLGDLTFATGTFAGMTVNSVIAIANDVIGGCSTAYSGVELSAALESVNLSFHEGGPSSGALNCVVDNCSYTVIRTWTATDICGNASSASQTINVQDVIAPVIDPLPGISTINCPNTPVFAQATASDDCDNNVTLTFNDVTTPGNCPGNYSVTRTWTATDDCGNASSASQTINVQDITAPVIASLPAPSTIDCPATPVFAQASATDACDSNVTLTFNDVTTPGNCPGNYSVTRTWTATDDCGNASSASQTINVQDITAPVIASLPAPSTIDCPATPVFAQASATDACDSNVTLTFNDVTTPGNCPGNYSVTRTWTATDDCGNASSASQTINVQDITAPVIASLPAPSTIDCPATPVFAQASATDACDSNVTLTFNDVTTPGNCPGNYSVTRTWTATDDCGNASSASQTINVQDITAPVIASLPAPSTIDCPATPVFAQASATDACDNNVTLTFNDVTTPGNCPGNYSVTRTWTATDDCGNASSASQTINVQDITAPVIASLPAPSTIDCPATPVFAQASATDACDSNVTLTFNDVTTPGNCPGNYSVTRTWTATDDCGNASSASQTINVQDITAPVITCPTSVQVSCSQNVPAPNTASVSATDACDNSLTIIWVGDVITNQTCANRYTITRTYRATDDCGNSSECIQLILVNDQTGPVMNCPMNMTVGCTAEVPAPNVNLVTATDGCGGSPVVTVDADVISNQSCVNRYTITRTYRATDVCGNVSTCSQTITVFDNTPPVITCPQNIVAGDCNTTDICTATATDNCTNAPVQITYNYACGNNFPVGNTLVQANAVDACGNTASCNFSVTIVANPVCDLAIPAILPMEGSVGNTLCVAANSNYTYSWTLTGNGWTITDGATSNCITYTAGAAGIQATFCVTITNQYGCSTTCCITFGSVSYQQCTYTQGFYGGNGKNCAGLKVIDVINQALSPSNGGNMVIGTPSSSRVLTILSTEGSCVNSKMPSGTSPAILPTSNGNVTCSTANGTAYLQGGRFKGVLVGQTIALGLNMRNSYGLSSFVLEGNEFTTNATTSCSNGTAVAGSERTFCIPFNVWEYLSAPKTIGKLYTLANQALGGNTPSGLTISDINAAVDAINNGFDGCRILTSFGTCNATRALEYADVDHPFESLEGRLELTTYPNPMGEEATMEFYSETDSKGTIEIYSSTGELVTTIFNGEMNGGETRLVRFNAAGLANGIYIGKLSAGNRVKYVKIIISK